MLGPDSHGREWGCGWAELDRGENPLSESSHGGRGQDRGDRPVSPEICQSDVRDSVHPYHFTDGTTPKEGNWLQCPKSSYGWNRVCSEQQESALPRKGLSVTEDPCGGQGAPRRLVPGRCPSVGLLGVPVYSLAVCLPQCPSPLPQSPGRSSLLIRTRTTELQLCTRPALGARLAASRWGWGGQQRAPQFSVPVSSAHAIRQENEARGSISSKYWKPFPDHQYSQKSPGWLERGCP